jgi:hypothetical protein
MLAHLETVIASTAPVPSRLTTLVVLEMPLMDQVLLAAWSGPELRTHLR